MEYVILQDGHAFINNVDLGDFIWIVDNDGEYANIKFGNVEILYRVQIFNDDIEMSVRQCIFALNGEIKNDI